MFFARRQHRLLDERRIHFAGCLNPSQDDRDNYDVDLARAQWNLFHWRQVSFLQARDKFATRWWLAGVHARAFARGVGGRPLCLCRFYGGLVPDLQIQRGQRAGKRRRARSVSAPRYCQTESRLDERRSGHYKIIATIWPPGCPTVCALSRQIRKTDCLSGIAYQEYHSE